MTARDDKHWRKKPVVIEAVRWDGWNLREIIDFTGLHPSANKWTWEEYESVVHKDGLKIFTDEGPMMATAGDWIIRGVKGEFYPCKPDIFALTYERASTPSHVAQSEAEKRGAHAIVALEGLWQNSWQRPVCPADFLSIRKFLGEPVPTKIEDGIADWEKASAPSTTPRSSETPRMDAVSVAMFAHFKTSAMTVQDIEDFLAEGRKLERELAEANAGKVKLTEMLAEEMAASVASATRQSENEAVIRADAALAVEEFLRDTHAPQWTKRLQNVVEAVLDRAFVNLQQAITDYEKSLHYPEPMNADDARSWQARRYEGLKALLLNRADGGKQTT